MTNKITIIHDCLECAFYQALHDACRTDDERETVREEYRAHVCNDHKPYREYPWAAVVPVIEKSALN